MPAMPSFVLIITFAPAPSIVEGVNYGTVGLSSSNNGK